MNRTFTAIIACATLLASMPPGAPASSEQSGGIAYDEIDRVLPGETAPPPGAFAEDAARIANLPPLPSAPAAPGSLGGGALGLMSMIPVAGFLAGVAQQAAAMAYVKSLEAYNARVTAAGKAYSDAGSLLHAAFYRGWSRIDVAAIHSGVIDKPQTGERIFLDLAKKTYRQQQGSTATDKTVDTYVVTEESPSDAVTISNVATRELPPLTISGTATRGFQTFATFAIATSTGWCKAGAHDLTEIEYDADIPDPQATSGPNASASDIARGACSGTSPGSHYATGHLVIFRSLELSNTIFGGLMRVSERGNIRALGSQDAALFAVPAGFVEERTP